MTVRRTPIPSEGRARKYFSGLRYWRTALASERFDIFEGLNLPLFKAPTGRTLLTVHDIRGMRYEAGVLEQAVYSFFFEKSLKAADHVITVSESIKQEIHSLFPQVSISVIYNGLDPAGFANISTLDLEAFRLKLAFPESFILAVGHLEQRKNYLKLIDAIAKLRDRGESRSLLIVGNDNGERQLIEERIKSTKLTGTVKLLSGLSDDEVRCAYKLCSLVVFPSSYEGFGIPILEAMAAGRPIALSNIAVFREITQGKGVYFPHDDADAMAAAIQTVTSSRSETKRLVDYGNERVQAFSFQTLSQQLEILYRSFMPEAEHNSQKITLDHVGF